MENASFPSSSALSVVGAGGDRFAALLGLEGDGGVGVGLLIAVQTMKECGGRLDVMNGEDGRTSFALELARAEVE